MSQTADTQQVSPEQKTEAPLQPSTGLVEKAPSLCANCDTPLSGRYCQECGQKSVVERSVFHMVGEFLHGILHFDSKAWRTLPALIISPGKLTRDYIDGKRARYVSPLFLFLFLNLVMFVTLSYLIINIDPEQSYKSWMKEGANNELLKAETRLDELHKQLQPLAENDPARVNIAREIEGQTRKKEGILKSLAVSEASDDSPVTTGASADLNQPKDPNQIAWIERSINHALQNPDLVVYKMKGTASKFAFILIPISLPIIWLLFVRRKDVALFDHCIFSLYSLSFICLLIIFAAIIGRVGFEKSAWALVMIVAPIHMFAQMRGTYGLTIGSALWRTLALVMTAIFSLCVYFIIITWLSL